MIAALFRIIYVQKRKKNAGIYVMLKEANGWIKETSLLLLFLAFS